MFFSVSYKQANNHTQKRTVLESIKLLQNNYIKRFNLIMNKY